MYEQQYSAQFAKTHRRVGRARRPLRVRAAEDRARLRANFLSLRNVVRHDDAIVRINH